MRETAEPLTPGWQLALGAWRALWFVLIPALLAAVAIHWLLPDQGLGSSGTERWLLQLASSYPFYFPLGLFLLFSGLIRYWRFYLPGGRYCSALPPELAARAKPGVIGELSAATEFAAWLERRDTQASLPARSADFVEMRGALRSALTNLDVAAVRAVLPPLRKVVLGELRKSRWRGLGAFVGLLLAAGVFSFVLRGSAFQVYRLTSASMSPSLVPGEYVLSSRLAYALPWQATSLPRRTDLVVFQRAGQEFAGDLVKRVIGLPGDRIEMVHGGHPKINGWEVPSCDAGQYLQFTPEGVLEGRLVVEFLGEGSYLTVHTPWGQPMAPYVVKPGEVFVIGDDRNESRDSRAWADGNPAGLPIAEVRGRVVRSLVLALADRPPRYRLFQPGQRLDVEVPGLDPRDLQDGIRRCLSSRPKQTEPPRPTQK